MYHANILSHTPELLCHDTGNSIYEYVKQLDNDNLRFFGEKSSQFHHELVAKHLKDVDVIKASTKLTALVIALIELLFIRIN